MCQVSFSEPGLLRRVRDRKRASAGFSREHPGAAAGAAVAAAGVGVLALGAGGGSPSSLVQRLEHAGGFLAAGHAEIQPLFFF